MKKKEKDILLDIQGFIHFALSDKTEKYSLNEVLYNIAHDCRGILNKERCFLPRTWKYKRFLKP